MKEIIRIKALKKDKFNFVVDVGGWQLSKEVNERDLLNLRKEVEDAIGLTKICEKLDCDGDDALIIKSFWDKKSNWKLCNDCKFKWEECHNCVVKTDSPLERDLLLALKNQGINCVLQRRVRKDGSFYEYPEEIDFNQILTIPDFYIENEKKKLCVYADGHTYHERNEYQALRDRNIDRELQKLGFVVLRYTGKEIRDDVKKVVDSILDNLS